MNNYIYAEYLEMAWEEVYSVYLDDFIKLKENKFLEEIKNDSIKGSTYRISYDVTYYHDLASVHFVLYLYSGGAHDIRFDRVYYYDLNLLKELTLSDIIEEPDHFLEDIKGIAKEELLTNHSNDIYEDENLLESGLEATLENYRYLLFDRDGLHVLFPPYQVGPWSSGEIMVVIPYERIAKYLKI